MCAIAPLPRHAPKANASNATPNAIGNHFSDPKVALRGKPNAMKTIPTPAVKSKTVGGEEKNMPTPIPKVTAIHAAKKMREGVIITKDTSYKKQDTNTRVIFCWLPKA